MKLFMQLSIFFACTCFVEITLAAVMISTDPCPGDRVKDDEWYLKPCQKCTCLSLGYQCASCGIVFIQPLPDCYVEYSQPNGLYPICCNKSQVCKGQPGFNVTKYKEYKKVIAIG